jgi:protein TonB
LAVSAAAHGAVAGAAMLMMAYRPTDAIVVAPAEPVRLIYMPMRAGPAGGGGGRLRPAPPARLEVPAHRTVTAVPVAVEAPAPDPVPVLDIPVQTDAASLLRSGGTMVTALPGPSGRGRGTGVGDGAGPGLDAGAGGNTGGGPRQVGGDVKAPVPIYTPRPSFTPAAVQAKRAGDVWVEAVVLADGTVGRVRIVRSLDKVFGLDDEALRNARLWRFQPGTLHGKPVDVIVILIIQFRIY